MNFWKDKRVFITGATGLVGSSLVKKLIHQKAFVVALVSDVNPNSEMYRNGTANKITVVNGRLEDYVCLERAISEYEIDTVFHLGAQAIVTVAYRSPLLTFESNIRGTYNLLEACRVHQPFVKRIVVASSDKAYGDVDALPYTEKMPPMGRFPYDVSKSCTDLLSRSYYETYELPTVVARCGNIYGEGDINWSRIIPGTIRSLCNNEQPIIRSDGKFTRDYIYVKDVISSYMMLAEQLENPKVVGKAFNFGPNNPYSVIEVVDGIRKAMNKMDIGPKILDSAQAEIRDQHLDSKMATETLGWKPKYSLDDGIKSTIPWYEKFLKNLKETKV